MAKVGILTYQRSLNYGATLQCHALFKTLQGFGLQVEVIDYRCEAVERNECQAIAAGSLSSALKYAMKMPLRREFAKFNGRLALSSPCDAASLPHIAERYDRIVVGSDQVWNPHINGGDRSFFLPFENDPKRCVGYAASMGGMCLPADPYAILLDRFSSILVRDRAALDEIGRLLPSRIDAKVVLDPTLLVSEEEWLRIARMPAGVRGKRYVLLYAVSEFEKSARIAASLADRLGCGVVQICLRRRGKAAGAAHLTHASPEEFLGLIAGAEAVVASSYHGVCFSLVFNREFYCTARPGGMGLGRFSGFLDELGLDERVLASIDDLDGIDSIDYGGVRPRLASMRDASLRALAASVGCAGPSKGVD